MIPQGDYPGWAVVAVLTLVFFVVDGLGWIVARGLAGQDPGAGLSIGVGALLSGLLLYWIMEATS